VDRLSDFHEIWFLDFEFFQPDGARPTPVCMVGRELRTGRLLRLWQDDLTTLVNPPFSIGPDALIVAYYVSAELGCFLALDWGMPVFVLDLFAEFRRHTAGLTVPCGNSLLGALAYYGLDSISAVEKEAMRNLAFRGGPYEPDEKQVLLDYCQSDVLRNPLPPGHA
jgi:DNA polymerase-1